MRGANDVARPRSLPQRPLSDLEDDPHRARPRPPNHRAVAERLNALAGVLNSAHEQLSQLRHELGVEARLDEMAMELSHRQSVMVAQERDEQALPWGDGVDD
jgi:hypothetical protein